MTQNVQGIISDVRDVIEEYEHDIADDLQEALDTERRKARYGYFNGREVTKDEFKLQVNPVTDSRRFYMVSLETDSEQAFLVDIGEDIFQDFHEAIASIDGTAVTHSPT